MTRSKLGSVALIFAIASLPPLAAQAQTLTTLYSFHRKPGGDYPFNIGLISFGHSLYGTTNKGGASNLGTVFSINPTTGFEHGVYAFKGGNDGQDPGAGLLNVGTMLYGTTLSGGPSNCGTVFALDTTARTESVLYSFTGGNDGVEPQAALIEVGGILYGTTLSGGPANAGTVFAVNPATGTETVLHAFGGTSDGVQPYASLLAVGGTLYGTTFFGGAYNYGTVFSIDPQTGTETVVYSFKDGSDGANPEAGLINVGGTLYGTTLSGGASSNGTLIGDGTLYTINPETGAEQVVYTFAGFPGDGEGPAAPLIDVGGILYGTTEVGGDGLGTAFAFNPATGEETVLHVFNGSDGDFLNGALLSNGNLLYGTAYMGGQYSRGTVFSLTPQSVGAQ